MVSVVREAWVEVSVTVGIVCVIQSWIEIDDRDHCGTQGVD